ncbi:3D domain-containing protein [Ectobacillus ponti]|uniref:3D domain-containing protein n=1 Tax=Ectobacillus ponti TaxID=2961894 RepID=A0AA41XBR6_9BACI|nr:3D domain-containing protein [Ectobacillus ponti]MCP8970743.1 3D domain-containing protein [Ectobacillus ponti]
MNIKKWLIASTITALLAVCGMWAMAADIKHRYEDKQTAHTKLLQEKKKLYAQTQLLKEQRESLEAALEQRKQLVQQKEQELEQTKQSLEAANQKLVTSGIVAPDEAGLATAAKTIQMKATAYSADPAENGGTYNGKVVTRTGFSLTDNPHAKVIAVDPSIIPLGSTVWVEGYGYAKALDTGSAIKGNRIDVFISDKGRMMDWGVKSIRVKVMSEA